MQCFAESPTRAKALCFTSKAWSVWWLEHRVGFEVVLLNPHTNMDLQGYLFHPGALHPCVSKKKTPTNQRWCHFPLQPKRDLQSRVFQNLWHHRKEILLLQHLMERHGRFRGSFKMGPVFWSKNMELIRFATRNGLNYKWVSGAYWAHHWQPEMLYG